METIKSFEVERQPGDNFRSKINEMCEKTITDLEQSNNKDESYELQIRNIETISKLFNNLNLDWLKSEQEAMALEQMEKTFSHHSEIIFLEKRKEIIDLLANLKRLS